MTRTADGGRSSRTAGPTTGTATPGQYTNIGTVNGDATIATTTVPLTASDNDCYFGANPQISISKLTNGTDNDAPTGPSVPVGSTVTP